MVEACGGRYKPFSHSGFLKTKELTALDSVNKGHCGGLSVLWLSRYDKKSLDSDMFADKWELEQKTFTQIANSTQGRVIIHQIQQYEASRIHLRKTIKEKYKSATKDDVKNKLAEDFGAIDAGTARYVLESGLKGLGHEKLEFSEPKTFTDSTIEDLMSYLFDTEHKFFTQDFQGHLIGFTNHYVAAITDFTDRNKLKFLDVNFGQAVFSEKYDWPMPSDWIGKWKDKKKGFRAFLKSYLSHPDVQEAYEIGSSPIEVATFTRK